MLDKYLDKGLVQVYTGEGKGKTTAALGQAFRAVGSGYKVYMIQFLKGRTSGELNAAQRLSPDFKIFRFEEERGFFWTLTEEQKEDLAAEVRKAFDFAKEVCGKEACNILILDEIMGVLHNGMLSVEEVCKFLQDKPERMEIILTGRGVPEQVKKAAHLVTEMKLIKHPFEEGIGARRGIEW